ncbi:type II toxin-antitoxin system RelE/ParE family toxin [Streptosporangium sandarakinum]|uniref:Proteic killer suppression protein n=1 Tax=Streptosporangium sandarakinum TaxID=1260955 RepID=A0A852UX94_9ACTN|nr:proteic killer suppression protein [Streptosporangium sandarakinum]
MEVFYADRRLQLVCQSDREMRAAYGAEGARKLGQRLQALRVANTLDDLFCMPGRCHPLRGNYSGCHAMDLHRGWRLVFRLMTPKEKADQGLAEEEAALVIEIVDYHG